MSFLYLLVNIATISIPFLFSFHPKLRFDKTWPAFFPALILTAIPFLIWDFYFTKIGVWGFNPAYLTGIYLLNLPMEEVLFFICIPYACVFTYHCLDKLFLHKINKSKEYFSIILIILLICGATFHREKIYTLTTFTSLAILIFLAKFIFKISWIKKFYIVYAILLLPFLIVNGVLTGTGIEGEIVWYNDGEYMGFRINTIPVEDVFYGMELIFLNLILYKKISSFWHFKNG